jgi:hypothetical protein
MIKKKRVKIINNKFSCRRVTIQQNIFWNLIFIFLLIRIRLDFLFESTLLRNENITNRCLNKRLFLRALKIMLRWHVNVNNVNIEVKDVCDHS